jgi:hypothetical protein
VIPFLKGNAVGTEPYLLERLSQDPAMYDDLSFGGRFAAYAWGTPLLLSIAPNILMDILPFLLGILTFLMFVLILKELTKDQTVRRISYLFLILSPAFIYAFSFPNQIFFALFLSVCGFYCFIKKKYKYWTIPIALILPLFNFTLAISFVVILFFYSFLWKKKKRKFFTLIFALSGIVSLAYYGFIIYNTGSPNGFLEQQNITLFQKIIFDLGSLYGIGIFTLILFIVGAISEWDKKYNNLFLFFSVLFLLVLSYFKPEALLLLTLFMIFIAALGLKSLLKNQWMELEFKGFVLTIVLLGVIFSAVAQLDVLSSSQPGIEITDAIDFLEDQEKGVVFSHYQNGVWINAAGQKNVLDENYLFVQDAKKRLQDSKKLFYSRDLEESTKLIEKYDISYVWVDDYFGEEVWKYDSQGLLFILQYTKGFNKIYDNGKVEIWSLKKDD